MKIRLLTHIACFLFANQVHARVIEVRSGEHDTFSRIVLNIPSGTEWALTQTGNLAELSIKLPEILFDTSQVFSRIPRGRLLQVSQRQPGGPLYLNMGCECKVMGFTQSGTLLVIDIQDAVEPVSSSFQIFNDAPKLTFNNVQLMDIPGSKLTWSLQFGAQDETAKPVSVIESDNLVAAIFPTHRTRSNVNASEVRLLAQIDRAAAQGLLLRNVEIVRPDGIYPTTHIHSENSDELVDFMEFPSFSNMTAITSIDLEHVDSIGLNQQMAGQHYCMPATFVALPDWGNALPFGTQIGNRRSDLYGEFDNVSQQGVIELARNLLFFGFGAEAKKTLSLLSDLDQTRKVLNAVAEILDNGQVLAHNPFLEQQGCDSDVALWAYLAGPDVVGSSRKNTGAILTGFARLPDHLRVLLGPILATKFSESQDIESANIVFRTVNRTLTRSNPALDLAQANSDMKYKNPNTAADQLVHIAQSGTGESPRALIDLVKAQILADQTIPPNVPDLIAAYLPEFRKSNLAPELRQAHILSLAITGRYGEAFKTYFENNTDAAESMREETLSKVMHLLVRRADNIKFLRYALVQIERSEFEFSISLQSSLAERLIELGFSTQAAILLSDKKSGFPKENRSLMNAQIAISENLPHRALAELLGVNEALAGDLRTEAFLSIGDYENAGLTQEANGTDPGRAFWLAENWDAVIRQGNSQFLNAAILARTLKDNGPDNGDQGPLASAQALADSSLVTRSDISKLLEMIR